jgi:hypothetical protein
VLVVREQYRVHGAGLGPALVPAHHRRSTRVRTGESDVMGAGRLGPLRHPPT